MVNVPVVTTLAMDDPDTRPVKPEETTAALAGPPLQMAEPGKSGADKVVAGAGRFQQGAKKHEHEDHTGGDAQGHPENTLGGQPVVGHPFGKAGALVGNDVRHIGAAESVNDKYARRPPSEGGPSARRVASSSMISPTTGNNQIQLGRIARAFGQFDIENKQIRRAKGTDQRQHPVLNRDIVSGRFFKSGISRKGEKNAKARWIARASVALKTKILKIKGRGDAYQS